MVRTLWDEEYKSLPTLSNSDEESPFKRLKAMSALERHRAHRTSSLAGRCSLESSLNADHDEYDHWLLSPDAKNDSLVMDPI